jgi:hypothetical protein
MVVKSGGSLVALARETVKLKGDEVVLNAYVALPGAVAEPVEHQLKQVGLNVHGQHG